MPLTIPTPTILIEKGILKGLQIKDTDIEQVGLHVFPDLDHGLEWCEEQILIQASPREHEGEDNLVSELVENGLERSLALHLLDYLEEVHLEPGERLIDQGEAADSMYFIENGRLSVYLDMDMDERVRLRTLQRGSSVGEMGLYLHQPRVATVIAEEPSTIYHLDRRALSKMEQDEPRLAASFHAMMVRNLSEMLSLTTRQVEALNR